MKVNVWYSLKAGYHRFASLYDECDYCYSAERYTFEEACARYEADHAHERAKYHFIIK